MDRGASQRYSGGGAGRRRRAASLFPGSLSSVIATVRPRGGEGAGRGGRGGVGRGGARVGVEGRGAGGRYTHLPFRIGSRPVPLTLVGPRDSLMSWFTWFGEGFIEDRGLAN